jgi:hypothetical protein
MTSNNIVSINSQNNNVLYSLHNVENYKTTINYSINDVLNKYNLLIIEYFKFITEKVNLKNASCNKFIIIRGLETISHVFNNILHYTKNMDLAFYHSQKAFYFYVEFIEQISDDQHTFLQLNSRDAALFVYKKTLFDINNDYRKNMIIEKNQQIIEYFDILQFHTNITKTIISFFIHKYNFSGDNKKNYINCVIEKTEQLIAKIGNCKLGVNSYKTILIFIERLNKDIHFDKYFEIIEIFLKKYLKGKVAETQIQEKIYSVEFDDRLEDNVDKFILWIFS